MSLLGGEQGAWGCVCRGGAKILPFRAVLSGPNCCGKKKRLKINKKCGEWLGSDVTHCRVWGGGGWGGGYWRNPESKCGKFSKAKTDNCPFERAASLSPHPALPTPPDPPSPVFSYTFPPFERDNPDCSHVPCQICVFLSIFFFPGEAKRCSSPAFSPPPPPTSSYRRARLQAGGGGVVNK